MMAAAVPGAAAPTGLPAILIRLDMAAAVSSAVVQVQLHGH